MKNIVKFEDNKIVFDTSKLKTKQMRNVFRLIRANNLGAALSYAAVVQNNKNRNRIYELQDLRNRTKPTPNAVSNRVYKMFQRLFDVSNAKGPSKMPIGQGIGVEIEFYMPRGRWDASACGECGNCEEGDEESCDNYDSGLSGARTYFTKLCTERKIKGVNIGEDGSIRVPDEDDSSWIALEARIITNINDLSNLEAFCKVLSEVGAEVNASCGLHVHLDMRDYERRPAAVANKLLQALPILKAMVPKSRIGNQYCQVDLGSGGNDSGRSQRYACINDVQAFSDHKTIEVRLHSGTINYTKISNWIRILYSVARHEGRISNASIEGLASELNWSASLVTYIVSRIKKFNPNSALLGTGSELTGIDVVSDSGHEESEAA
jgi:hypothetical protein